MRIIGTFINYFNEGKLHNRKNDLEKFLKRLVFALDMINMNIERDIIKVSGEKNAPGKPYLYKTTDFFLEVFSLNNISEIPDIDEFNDYDASET